MKKKLTATEKAYHDKVRALGCIIPYITGSHADCRILGEGVELHHPTGAGLGLRSSHYDVLPICFAHHSAQTHLKCSVHKCTQTFESLYGTQMELVGKVKELLGHDEVGI